MSLDIYGKTHWVFPDAEMPPEGVYTLRGHESLIILNMAESDAAVDMTLFFEDAPPVGPIGVTVESKRVRCIRMDDAGALGGYTVERERQYAISLSSDVPVVAQYGRLDTRNQPMAFYTTPGYSC